MEDAALLTLRRLRKTRPWLEELKRWPAEWREAWEERAAIMEYDAGLPRAKAEALAFEDVKRCNVQNGRNGNVCEP